MKTKLLGEIATQSETLVQLCSALSNKLATATDVEDPHWKALSDIISARDTLRQTVSRLEKHIQGWDGSVEIKNLLKNKPALAKARQETKEKVVLIQQETKALHDLVNEVIELMKQVSRRAASH